MRTILNFWLVGIGLLAFALPLALDQLDLAHFDTYTMGASALVGLVVVVTCADSAMGSGTRRRR